MDIEEILLSKNYAQITWFSTKTETESYHRVIYYTAVVMAALALVVAFVWW